jgi:L-amino acid N-acyltransferase YncA
MIEIRDVTIDDAEEIAGILNPIILARCYTAIDTPVSVDDERRFIQKFPSRGIFLVAVDTTSAHVVGLQDVSPFGDDFTHAFDHVGVIGTYVDLNRRREGIASRLFAAMFESAPRKGYEKLFTYVRADNEAALQIYRKQGFRIIGTSTRHCRIDGKYIDEIMIERSVD